MTGVDRQIRGATTTGERKNDVVFINHIIMLVLLPRNETELI